MSKKKKMGRPIGGEAPPEIRKYWREYKRKQRAKKKEAQAE